MERDKLAYRQETSQEIFPEVWQYFHGGTSLNEEQLCIETWRGDERKKKTLWNTNLHAWEMPRGYMLLRTSSPQIPSIPPIPTTNTVPPSGKTMSSGPSQSEGNVRLLTSAARVTLTSSWQLAEYAAIYQTPWPGPREQLTS